MAEKRRYLSRAMRTGADAADNIIDSAVEIGGETIKQATKTGRELSTAAADEVAAAYKAGGEKMQEGMDEARRIVSGARDMDTLEKLGKMWQAGIITDAEFQDAKRKILERL